VKDALNLLARLKVKRIIISAPYAVHKTIEKSIQYHRGIKNKVHWVSDVAFNEDLSRKRDGNAAQNFSSLNRIVINLLRKNELKIGIISRLKIYGWDHDYLQNIQKIRCVCPALSVN